MRTLGEASEKALFRLGHRWTVSRHRPEERWHSWDPSPAQHPWLTPENLGQIRAFSERVYEKAHEASRRGEAQRMRFAFVGNLANYLYKRAVPLRKRGYQIDLILHPDDTYIMSQPGWEEWDGELQTGSRSVPELEAEGIRMPSVDGVVTLAQVQLQVEPTKFLSSDRYLRRADVLRFPGYLTYAPILRYLQRMDALLTTQSPYLAYLARRPYLAAQGGGDLWLVCSRDDLHGQLFRTSFAGARAILASNPWTFGHARRFGFRNAIYLPFMLDDELYSPGPPRYRAEWEQRTGGRFFVLSTARLDERYKGSSTALEGFASFAARNSDARLVVIDWGDDAPRQLQRLRELGISDVVLVLPVAGKRRVVDYLRSADCLLDQFALGAYGATALEAMGCALPVVMRLELHQYRALCGSAPPVLNATTPAEVADRLELLAERPDKRSELADAHRAWFLANHGSSTWADRYGDLLRATGLGYRFNYRSSPLTARPSAAERDYYEEGLRHAPAFPNYQ